VANFEKLCAVYYPDVVIENKSALATFCLYFDEVHCVPFFPLYESKKTNLKDFQIILPFPVEGDEISSFLVDNGPLEDEVLFYKRDIIDKIVHGETSESAELSDLAGIVFRQGHPNMHSIVRFCVIGILAEKLGWMPVGDKSDIPIPVPEEISSLSDLLSSTSREECFSFLLPVCLPVSSKDILEARNNLNDELLPFRDAVQELSDALRMEPLPSDSSMADLKQEARSLVEKTVEPVLNDLRKRIELEKGKLWRRVFGSTLTSVPLIANVFASPSPNLILESLEKASKDMEGIPLEARETSASIRSGVSFVLEVDKK
jgi:hypothetical protein